jgi:Cof subfamily protein (haloacid dehalogenase superfamily)
LGPTAAAESLSVRVVFVDYDGTLLSDSRDVSDVTRQALRAARCAELRVVPASSRPLMGLRIPGIDEHDAAIPRNGAVVQRRGITTLLEADPLQGRAVQRCIDIGGARGVSISLYTSKNWLADDVANPCVKREQDRVAFAPIPLEPMRAPARIQNILLSGERNSLDACERDMARPELHHDVHWFRSEPEYLEVGRRGVTKATGIKMVNGWMGPTRTYAIGDGESDIPMFGEVDVAIVVGNASEDVRIHVDLVVGTNAEDGVAEALEQIVAGRI